MIHSAELPTSLVPEGAVKSIVQQLFRKAGVRKRGQLVRVALESALTAARIQGKRARTVTS